MKKIILRGYNSFIGKNCTKLLNRCNVIIDNSKEKTLTDSYKFTIPQLKESVKKSSIINNLIHKFGG